VTNNYVDSGWIPDLFTMEIYNCTHYNYIEHLALVAPWIPLTELYCSDVSLPGLITSDSGD
jgi:hypothetical protein